MPAARGVFSGLAGIAYADSPLAALDGADALAVVTEWQEFRSPDFQAIRARLKTPRSSTDAISTIRRSSRGLAWSTIRSGGRRLKA